MGTSDRPLPGVWGAPDYNSRSSTYRGPSAAKEVLRSRMERQQQIQNSRHDERLLEERLLEERQARLDQRARAEAARVEAARVETEQIEAAFAESAREQRELEERERALQRSSITSHNEPPPDLVQLSSDAIKMDTTPDPGFGAIGMHPVDKKFDETRSDKLQPEDGIRSQSVHDKRAEGVPVHNEFHDPGEYAPRQDRDDDREWQVAKGYRDRKRTSQSKSREKSGGGAHPGKSLERPIERPSGGIINTALAKIHRMTMSPEQERDDWRRKYEELDRNYGQMEDYYNQQKDKADDLKAKLRSEKDHSHLLREECDVISGVRDEFKNRCHHNQRAYEDAERRAHNLQKDLFTKTDEFLKERDHLKTQIDELYTSHIRSVNTVGTGLDPISDDAIGKRFTDLSDEIYLWCRQTFRGKPDIMKLAELDPFVREKMYRLLGSRLLDTDTISYSRLIETITWGYIESAIFSVWFPRMVPDYLETIGTLQEWITAGDKSLHKERKEFWRAYTCSLLFQNNTVAASLQDVDHFMEALSSLYGSVQRDKIGLSESKAGALQQRLRKAMVLAAELKCQRGAYELDDNIMIGDPYDETRMDDVGFTEDTCETPVVSCILSKGWVRRPFAGAERVDSRVYKARVLVEEARK